MNITTSAAATAIVGASQPALSWNVLLTLGAVMIAAMQGVVVMESSEPCRISYKKWKVLLVLELLQVGIFLITEVVAYFHLSSALGESLRWLHWVAPVLLIYGLVEILIDIWFVLKMSVRSRLHWIPFSAIGRKKKRNALEVAPMFLTFIFAVVLIGWRQRWWLASPPVDTLSASLASTGNPALSNGVIGLCMAWSLILSLVLLGFLVFNETSLVIEGYPSLIHELMGSRTPGYFLARHPSSYGMSREPTGVHVGLYELSHHIEHGEDPPISDEEKKRNLAIAPLHVGNAVVGPDREAVYDGFGEGRFRYLVVSFVAHCTVLPILICVLAATAQLHGNLDEPTFRALAELVNAVLILTLFELAVGLKTYLWGLGYQKGVHPYDRTADEPEQVTHEPDVMEQYVDFKDPVVIGSSTSSYERNAGERGDMTGLDIEPEEVDV